MNSKEDLTSEIIEFLDKNTEKALLITKCHVVTDTKTLCPILCLGDGTHIFFKYKISSMLLMQSLSSSSINEYFMEEIIKPHMRSKVIDKILN